MAPYYANPLTHHFLTPPCYRTRMPPAQVLITIDTELSAGLQQRGLSARENFDRSIRCITDSGDVGIGWQMAMLNQYGLTGVFFVDPMPALVYGCEIIADIVAPIIAAGHEVQLHIHTEWLEFANAQPVGDLRGRNIADFPFAAQVTLLTLARDLLVAAGAPLPNAFRAGNYGANDDTLRALAALGFAYDSSFNPAYLGHGCDIGLPASQSAIASYQTIDIVPVSAIHDRPGKLRHMQLCALSAAEMRAGLAHAGTAGADPVVIVSHSFELLSRDRLRANSLMQRRFEAMCAAIANNKRLKTCGFHDLSPVRHSAPRLSPSWPRTAWRMGEQAWAHWRYERA